MSRSLRTLFPCNIRLLSGPAKYAAAKSDHGRFLLNASRPITSETRWRSYRPRALCPPDSILSEPGFLPARTLQRNYTPTFSSDVIPPREKQPIDEVDYEYVRELVKADKGVIIDVREVEEVRGLYGTIPGSVNIPLGEVKEAFQLKPKELAARYGIDNLKSQNDEIILHCKGGVRSEVATRTAKSLGYKNAKNYKGSMDEWHEKETERNEYIPHKPFPVKPR